MRSILLILSVFVLSVSCLAQGAPAHCAYPTANKNHMIGGGTSPLGRNMGGDKCVNRCQKNLVIQPVYTEPVPPGVPIPFTVQLNGQLGGAAQPDGGTTKLCYAGGGIDFGDGGKAAMYTTGFINPCNHLQTGYLTEPLNEHFTHTFPVTDAPEALYCVSANVFGDFAYSANDGSCSYECNLQVSIPVTVSKSAKLPNGTTTLKQ
jgi:hypothetical protein